MQKYYFTFGTDPKFPYQRGWVEVEAHDKNQACNIFRAYFPDRTKNIINCAFVYSENEWKKTKMGKGDYAVPGEFCHAKIGLQERKDFNKISIPINDGLRIQAEINLDPDYREIIVGVFDSEQYLWCQDLAIVRQKYHYDHNLNVIQEDKYEVLVYADSEQEDYTDLFVIDRYKAPQEDDNN